MPLLRLAHITATVFAWIICIYMMEVAETQHPGTYLAARERALHLFLVACVLHMSLGLWKRKTSTRHRHP